MNDTILPERLAVLDKLITAGGGPYAAGSKMTVVDMELYAIGTALRSGLLDGIDKTLFQKFKAAEAVYQKVHANPAVVAWMKHEAALKAKAKTSSSA